MQHHMKLHKMQQQTIDDCVLLHIAGALYFCQGFIIFEVFKKNGDQLYLKMIVYHEQITEDTYVFRWDQIPSEILQLYTYVNSKSIIQDGTLYGTHILRNDNIKYVVCRINHNTIGQTQTLVVDNANYDSNTLSFIAKRMKVIKNI